MVLFVVGLVLLILAVAAREGSISARLHGGLGLAVLAIAGVLVATAPAHAAERPRLSPQGCSMVAEMVLVARSLSQVGVDRDTAAAAMRLVYAEYSDGGGIDEIRAELVVLAYRRKEEPITLAKMIGGLCLANQGALDQVLGSPVRWRF
jgi:hypothetical protein